jgi:predicted patatin/cPLA2 family phospholipase
MDASNDKFTLFGNNPEVVLRKLWQRKQGNVLSHPTKEKLGLIIDGGAMRIIIAGGVLSVLHQLGFNKIFDNIYGTSAGAIAGAYFIAGQSPYAASMCCEDINQQLIKPYRFPRFFNLDYIMDIMEYKKKLDVKAVRESKTKLIINATEIATGEVHFFDNHQEELDLLTIIKASCALPVYYDKPVEINGKDYLDGGVIGPLPLLKAIEDGCTDILVLLTKTVKNKNNSYNFLSQFLDWFRMLYLKKYGRNFIQSYVQKLKSHFFVYETMKGLNEKSKNINIAAIAPLNGNIHTYTINSLKLKKIYKESYEYTLKLLQNPLN